MGVQAAMADQVVPEGREEMVGGAVTAAKLAAGAMAALEGTEALGAWGEEVPVGFLSASISSRIQPQY
jgi:hypothetical protein